MKNMGIKVEGNYVHMKDITNVILAASAFGFDKEFNYAVNIKGVESRFWEKPFGRQIDSLKIIRDFQKTAKKDYVSAKGKPTITAVKSWIKINKPLYFYAKWPKDSTNYKDDSVEIFYE